MLSHGPQSSPPLPLGPNVYLDLALIFLLLRWRRLCLFFFHFHRISARGGFIVRTPQRGNVPGRKLSGPERGPVPLEGRHNMRNHGHSGNRSRTAAVGNASPGSRDAREGLCQLPGSGPPTHRGCWPLGEILGRAHESMHSHPPRGCRNAGGGRWHIAAGSAVISIKRCGTREIALPCAPPSRKQVGFRQMVSRSPR